MDARMVIAEPTIGHLDHLAGFWDEEVVAQITGQRGNCGFFLFTDVANRRVVAVSLWDCAADADAAGLTFRSHMASVSSYLASPPQVERLEVVVASGLVLGGRRV